MHVTTMCTRTREQLAFVFPFLWASVQFLTC